MSYSFTVSAASKADAKQKIGEAFDSVVSNQPSHKADRDAAVTCGQAFVDILKDPPEGHEIVVSMHGSLSWNGEYNSPADFTSSSVGISASLREKPKPAA